MKLGLSQRTPGFGRAIGKRKGSPAELWPLDFQGLLQINPPLIGTDLKAERLIDSRVLEQRHLLFRLEAL
jgi:hypothetical protein